MLRGPEFCRSIGCLSVDVKFNDLLSRTGQWSGKCYTLFQCGHGQCSDTNDSIWLSTLAIDLDGEYPSEVKDRWLLVYDI